MSRLESLRIKAKLLQKSKRQAGKPIPLKDAYDIIAKSAGYESWRTMKSTVARYAIFRPAKAGLPYWNNWYSSYEQAKQHLQEHAEFLLPFEDHFFICGIDYIESLGISRNDSDLCLVGPDWVSPRNPEALERLMKKIKERQGSV